MGLNKDRLKRFKGAASGLVNNLNRAGKFSRRTFFVEEGEFDFLANKYEIFVRARQNDQDVLAATVTILGGNDDAPEGDVILTTPWGKISFKESKLPLSESEIIVVSSGIYNTILQNVVPRLLPASVL